MAAAELAHFEGCLGARDASAEIIGEPLMIEVVLGADFPVLGFDRGFDGAAHLGS